MRGVQNGETLRQIHALFDVGTAAGFTDGELLERYATRGGEAAELAFATLVERHGPVVYRVCRRMLRDPNDAQDAFQAAFLVLVRKAGSIRNRDSVGSWLYGVAVRVASDSRAAASRRATHERKAARPELELAASNDLSEALVEEVGKLPEKFRIPIVLCDLEGYTCEEAARRLKWPLGTVRSRLTRGKERLRTRLERRGLAPSAGVITAVLRTPADTLPPALLGATLRTAISITTGRAVAGAVSGPVFALSEGVLRAMFISKLKTAVGILLAASVAGGVGVLAQQESGVARRPGTSPARVRYEIRISVDGQPSGEPIIADVAEGSSITLATPDESIQINRKPTRAMAPEAEAIRGPSGNMGMGPNMRQNQEDAQAPKRKGVDVRSSRRVQRSAPSESPSSGSMMGGMMRPAAEADARGPVQRSETETPRNPDAKGTVPGIMESGMAAMMRGGKPGAAPDAAPNAGEGGPTGTMGMMRGGMPGAAHAGAPDAAPGTAEGASAGMMGMMRGGMPGAADAGAPEAAPGTGDGGPSAMSRMMGGAAAGSMMGQTPSADQEQRLREVERRLDEILKRLEDRKAEKPPAARP